VKTAYFMDFAFETEGVTFYPRPETELLVEKAVSFVSLGRGYGPPQRIMDIGTGCGSIAISLAKYLPLSRIVATDISDSALRVAADNSLRYGLAARIDFIRSDLFADMDRNQYRDFFDLIISNPPYVPLEDFPSLSAKTKEDPYISLSGGVGGMDFYEKIKTEAPFFLKQNGILLMEMGYGQSENIKTMLEESGAFYSIEIFKDYSGIDRIIKASLG